jgi:hypothetical protein
VRRCSIAMLGGAVASRSSCSENVSETSVDNGSVAASISGNRLSPPNRPGRETALPASSATARTETAAITYCAAR